jgi:hypothetical protein
LLTSHLASPCSIELEGVEEPIQVENERFIVKPMTVRWELLAVFSGSLRLHRALTRRFSCSVFVEELGKALGFDSSTIQLCNEVQCELRLFGWTQPRHGVSLRCPCSQEGELLLPDQTATSGKAMRFMGRPFTVSSRQ